MGELNVNYTLWASTLLCLAAFAFVYWGVFDSSAAVRSPIAGPVLAGGLPLVGLLWVAVVLAAREEERLK